MDYAEQAAAEQAKWLTPADIAIIEADVRRRAFSFDKEQDIAGKVRSTVWSAASEMERAGTDLCFWLLQGLKEVDADCMIQPPRMPKFPYGKDGLEALNELRALIEASIVETEADRAEYGDAPIDFSDVRAWLTVTPYTLYRFREHVTDWAADAARDALEELLEGDSPNSIHRATTGARESWIKAFRKDGTVK